MVLNSPVSLSYGNSYKSAQVSMTGVSYGIYRTVLLLLMVLLFALANLPVPAAHQPPSAPSPVPSPSPSSSAPQPRPAPPRPSTKDSSSSSSPLSPSPSPPPSSTPAPQGAAPGSNVTGLQTKGAGRRKVTGENRATMDKLEKVWLHRAGLQKRPTIKPEYAVPEYMLDLYRSHASSGYLQVKGTGPVPANTVRSFVHNGGRGRGGERVLAILPSVCLIAEYLTKNEYWNRALESPSERCAPPLCSRLHFDVSSITSDEILTGAELRIFVNTGRAEDDRPSVSGDAAEGAVAPSRRNPLSNATLHRLEVYEVMRPETLDGEAITRLLDTRVVNLESSGWESFDIQPAVLKWKRGVNHGIEVRLASRTPALSTDHHVRVRRAAVLKDHEWALQRPILVTYTDDQLGPRPTSSSSSSTPIERTKGKISRRRRNAGGAGGGGAQKTKDENRKNGKKKNRRKKKKKKGNKNLCKRHNLYVNFDEVGWNDWIVAPDGYNAYFCHGECMAPLPDFAKATNHAMLQARVYKVNPSSVPMVCCVPVKMSSMSMLYRDEQGKTILKVYQDMSVDECGCK
ncbi:Bone morphogenetic protein 2 [Bulinus truncatus]|nr:Bone morphogenetic protein 2 [Bulinus truncatus]